MDKDDIAWLRCAVALSLPQIKVACPEAYFRLAAALEGTAKTDGLVELANATIEDLRTIARDCAMARPQAMGRAHLTDRGHAINRSTGCNTVQPPTSGTKAE